MILVNFVYFQNYQPMSVWGWSVNRYIWVLLLSNCTTSNSFFREIRLTPKQVNDEVELLQKFSGEEGNSALEAIQFTSNYQFDNGCHAPPWRQVHGDICYLLVKPLDGDELTVTANTAGIYLNKVGCIKFNPIQSLFLHQYDL